MSKPWYLRWRHPLHLQHSYAWEPTTLGRVRWTIADEGRNRVGVLLLEQGIDGIHWRLAPDNGESQHTAADCETLRQGQDWGGILFYAHPCIHGFPWSVPDSVANRHVLRAIKKQPFRRFKGSRYALASTVQKLRLTANDSAWQAAALSQTPASIWTHNNELTEYQVWVNYRVAVRQLNLYFMGRPRDAGCRKLQCCRGIKETMEHVFWTCPCAQACRQKLICHWTGECWELTPLHHFIANCASRHAPELSQVVKDRMRRDHPGEEDEYRRVWERMWHVLSSVALTSQWNQRNRATFLQEAVSLECCVSEFWNTGLRQFRAVAKRKYRQTDNKVQGARLLLDHGELARQPREPSPQVTSPEQPSDSSEEPALLCRLRTYQTSCNP